MSDTPIRLPSLKKSDAEHLLDALSFYRGAAFKNEHPLYEEIRLLHNKFNEWLLQYGIGELL